MSSTNLTRRAALGAMAAGLAAPFAFRHYTTAAPSETLNHASFGAGGMAGSDIGSLTASKHLKLVAVADVDINTANGLKKKFPHLRVYQDWRVLLDKEKDLHSVNISTPDHMHAPITMRAMQQGLNVYTQKPLTQTIHEARQLAKVAADKKIVSQMGIQVHANSLHRTFVALVQAGTIGKIRAVYSWSGKSWGDTATIPDRKDPVPNGLDWDGWLGVAADRPFIGGGYYHPGNWRKRLEFGTGTFGDMGCHILDPVFAALEIKDPVSVRSKGDQPNDYNWALETVVEFQFKGTRYTTDAVELMWYSGAGRPPKDLIDKVGGKVIDQGTIYVGTDGVMYTPYLSEPVIVPAEKAAEAKRLRQGDGNHYLEFVEACRGNGKTSTPFSYSGPLTEAVLLGCLSTRFKDTTLNWDSAKLEVTNEKKANAFVRREYRKGWEVEGL